MYYGLITSLGIPQILAPNNFIHGDDSWTVFQLWCLGVESLKKD